MRLTFDTAIPAHPHPDGKLDPWGEAKIFLIV
jgi:hypothetical protein